MPDRKVTERDRENIAEQVHEEFKRRKGTSHREMRENQWADVDRQLAMKVPEKTSERIEDWMSAGELPLQATSLEVITKEASRLIFPDTTDWYTANAEFTDEWAERVKETSFVAGDKGGTTLGDPSFDTGDLLVHAALDHNHRQYRYRENWKQLVAEALKYGTYIMRHAIVKRSAVSMDHNSVTGRQQRIPMSIPVCVKNYLPDDSLQHLLHEGMEVMPSPIRFYWQKVRDIQRAAKVGGEDQGWVASAVSNLEAAKSGGDDPEQQKGTCQIVELEGDLVTPRSRSEDREFFNKIVTVAVGSGGPKLIRIRDGEEFRSYVEGRYQTDDLTNPYGTSPLIKGVILEDIASEAANRMTDAADLNVRPPVGYSANDVKLVADGGPDLSPGARFKTKFPNAVEVMNNIGDPTALSGILSLMTNMYQFFVATTDERATGALKSHTTAFAADMAQSRGSLRTEDFVSDLERGPLTNSLAIEYELTKKAFGGRTVPVYIDARGLKGFIHFTGAILPKNVVFDVHGSRGVISKRERKQEAMTLASMWLQVVQAMNAAQLPPEQRSGVLELFKEVFREFGFPDPERIIGPAEGLSEAAEGERGLPLELGGVQGAGGLPGA